MSVPRFLVTASPHLGGGDSTPRIMWNVVGSLVPVCAAAIWFFGVSAILVIGTAVLGAVSTEWLLTAERPRGKTLGDNSAWLTGAAGRPRSTQMKFATEGMNPSPRARNPACSWAMPA